MQRAPIYTIPERTRKWMELEYYIIISFPLPIFRGSCCFRECISRYITKTFSYLKWRFPVLSSSFVGVVKVSLTSDVYIYIYSGLDR